MSGESPPNTSACRRQASIMRNSSTEHSMGGEPKRVGQIARRPARPAIEATDFSFHGPLPIDAELIKKLRRFVLPTHHHTISDLLKIETRESPNEPDRCQDFFNGILEI